MFGSSYIVFEKKVVDQINKGRHDLFRKIFHFQICSPTHCVWFVLFVFFRCVVVSEYVGYTRASRSLLRKESKTEHCDEHYYLRFINWPSPDGIQMA